MRSTAIRVTDPAATFRRKLSLTVAPSAQTASQPESAAETADHARRLAEVRAAADRPGFVVSDVESRIGATYTAETIRALQARHPRVHFVWIMGADNLGGFHRWRGWTDIMARIPVAVIARPGGSVRARLSRAAGRYRWARIDPREAAALPDLPPPVWTYLNAPLNPASSTALRAAQSKGGQSKKVQSRGSQRSGGPLRALMARLRGP